MEHDAAASGVDAIGVFLDLEKLRQGGTDPKEALLAALRHIHGMGWIASQKMGRSGVPEPYIIDTAPHSDSAALEAAKAADLILVPCRPAILDIEAISSTLNLVKTTGTPIFVVMNAVAPQGNEATEAAEAIAALGVGICPVELRQRVAFSRALITGQSAEEFEPGVRRRKRLHNCTLSCVNTCSFPHANSKGTRHEQQVRRSSEVKISDD